MGSAVFVCINLDIHPITSIAMCPCSFREDNWTFFLKLHLDWRCEYLHEKWNPFNGEKEYKDLSIRERVEVLHRLCHWRMELDDVGELVRVSVTG